MRYKVTLGCHAYVGQPFVRGFCPFWIKFKGSLVVFQGFVRPRFCENSIIESSGNQHFTDVVLVFISFMETCFFLIEILFLFDIRKASWQPRTLPKRKISHFSSTTWSLNIDKTKFDPFVFDPKFGIASF